MSDAPPLHAATPTAGASPASTAPQVAKPAAGEVPQAPAVQARQPRRPVMRRVSPSQKLMLAAFAWLDERFRIRAYIDTLSDIYYEMNMQFPRSHVERYRLRSIWYWYPLYSLGSLSFLAFNIATISGVLLALYYIPSNAACDPTSPAACEPGVSLAWQSVSYIMTQVPFGTMLRSIHFWSAMVMVSAVVLHMLRVYFTQAYKKPRELNWLLGVGLFGVTILLGYSGYLLPWSQLSYWAGTIGLEMSHASPVIGTWLQGFLFGGTVLSQATLTRMYVLHIFLFPAIAFGLMIVHMLIVWLQGIAEPH
jgi:quinol-cytochrome oxidoreductase complex cytochrome b subunit